MVKSVMTELIPDNYESRAFLGELANRGLVERVNETASRLQTERVLRPVDTPDERRAEGAAIKMIGDLKGGADSVAGLQRRLESGTEEEKVKAEEALMILEKSVFIAGSYGGADDDELVAAIGAGSVGEVDALLPPALKGLGERVVSNNIQNSEVLRILRKLDGIRERVKVGPILKRKIEASVEELLELSGLDAEAEREVQMACTYLSMELMDENDGPMSGDMTGETKVVKGGQRPPPELVPPRLPKGDDEEPGRWEERSWDMTYERFVELEQQQVDPRWFAARPPEWYSRMDKEARALIDIRIKLLETAASKREVRNKLPVEKLRTGVVPELDGKEFGLLWEKMPGFKEAMGFLVRDICKAYPDSEGRIFLKLKKDGEKMDEGVFDWLNDFDTLRDHVARQVAADRMGISVSEVGELETQDIEAVSAMWNFLFVGDSIEAWDYDRELKPTWICSDKLRTAYHLRAKALGKWRIYKASGIEPGVPTGVKPETEGEEEPFVSPAMAGWVLDRLKYEDGFADRILSGDLKEILPDTLAVSMIETQKVKLRDGSTTTMAMALLRGLEDEVILERNDRNIMQVHNDQVQGADFLAAAFKGKQPLDMAKNGDEWIGAYVENTGLIRQVPTILKTDGTFTVLPCVDRPMFVWAILLNSMGFDPSDRFPLLPERKMSDGSKAYVVALRDIIDAMGTRSVFDKRKVRELLGAKDLFDHGKRKMANDLERLKRTPRGRLG